MRMVLRFAGVLGIQLGLEMCAALGQGSISASSVRLGVNPSPVCRDERTTYPNFDLLIENHGPAEVRVKEVRGLAFDRAGAMLERRVLAQDAMSVLGDSVTARTDVTDIIYNPFSFSRLATADHLQYEIDLEGGTSPLTVQVPLGGCAPQHPFIVPVKARMLVSEGHDFLSHHRRGRYLGKQGRELGLIDNFQRFALDLVAVDERGRTYRGDGKKNSDFYGWDLPVRAMADGVVAEIHDGQPDNEVVGTTDKYEGQITSDHPMVSYGNYVLLKHGEGEFSIAAHMKNGSIAVKPGQTVKAGYVIGHVGNSGSSLGPHTHVERRTGPGLANMRTLPPYFEHVVRVGGKAESGPTVLDTGDVVIGR